jgi:hypothetical protein
MIATIESINDESTHAVTIFSTFSTQEDELHRDGEQSSLPGMSNKSLRNLDDSKQLEYWKTRAIKAILSNKELLKKNEKLEENLSDLARRADRFEKRAERLSRELNSLLPVPNAGGTRYNTHCAVCGDCVIMEEDSSKGATMTGPNGSYDTIPRDTVLENLLRKSIRRKWESV